jgi:hypothetical protein
MPADKPPLLTVEEVDACIRDGACLPDEWRAVLRAARAMAVFAECGQVTFTGDGGYSKPWVATLYRNDADGNDITSQGHGASPVEAIEDAEATR